MGELNLALEVLCEILHENELPISSRAYKLLQEIGYVLKIDNRLLEMLESQLAD